MKLAYIVMIILPFLVGCSSAPDGQPNIIGVTSGHKWDKEYKELLEKQYQNLPQYISINYASITDPNKRAASRNIIIKDLMWLDDYYYQQTVANLYNRSNNINFVSDVTLLALTSAATVAGGAEAKTVLAGVATMVTGVKVTYDADFLHRQTVTAIVNEMNALRADRHGDIVGGLNMKDSDYSLQDGLADVQKYIEAGTTAIAIIEMEKVTAANATTAKATLQMKLGRGAK